MKKERFCVNCQHYLPSERCAVSPKVNPVSGEKTFYFCNTIRLSTCKDDCGPDGKLWEPKMEVAE